MGRVSNILLDADGSIWRLGYYVSDLTDQSVWVLANINETQIITQELPIHSVSSTVPDPQHGIWLRTDRGWLYSDGKDVRLGLAGLEACVGPRYVKEIAIDPKGTAWVLTGFDGVYTLLSGAVEWQHVADPTQTGQSTEPIVSIAAATEGGIWATHGDDLFRFGSADVMLPIRLPENCHIGKSIEGKLIVKAGSVWGTGTDCGLLQFDVSNATWTLHRAISVPAGRVDMGTDGTLYALGYGPLGTGLYAYASKGQPGDSGAPIHQWIRVADVLGTVMTADRANGVWLASPHGGDLWYYNNSRVTTFDPPFGKYQLRGLNVDSQNRLWIHLLNTLMVYDGHSFRRVAVPINFISALTVAPDDHLWMSDDEIFAVYDPAADKQP
jgi:ligand-binding sensor domain-containing protein